MNADAGILEERRCRWLALADQHPPEWLASYVSSGQASCVVVTEHGGGGEPCMACLESMEDLPYWAFALAKSYLDDVGEWPLLGMSVEYALLDYESHGDPERALEEIMATIQSVWCDVAVRFVGMGSH